MRNVQLGLFGSFTGLLVAVPWTKRRFIGFPMFFAGQEYLDFPQKKPNGIWEFLRPYDNKFWSINGCFGVVGLEILPRSAGCTGWQDDFCKGLPCRTVSSSFWLADKGKQVVQDGCYIQFDVTALPGMFVILFQISLVLRGYNTRVFLVIAMNAFGGLLCAVMLKYAGATHGCFSTALSIILTCVMHLVNFREQSFFFFLNDLYAEVRCQDNKILSKVQKSPDFGL